MIFKFIMDLSEYIEYVNKVLEEFLITICYVYFYIVVFLLLWTCGSVFYFKE